MSQLNARDLRSVYLITYSRANLLKVPNREAFSQMVCNAFVTQTPASPVHWVCAKEKHQDGGVHFHCAIKLDRQQRWLSVRDYLQTSQNIQVNFSNNHCNYYSAWVYTTKEDQSYIFSDNHPDLTNGPPRTMAASQERTHSHIDAPRANRKVKRLRPFDVSTIITSKGIKSALELMALAKVQKDEGKLDLTERNL